MLDFLYFIIRKKLSPCGRNWLFCLINSANICSYFCCDYKILCCFMIIWIVKSSSDLALPEVNRFIILSISGANMKELSGRHQFKYHQPIHVTALWAAGGVIPYVHITFTFITYSDLFCIIYLVKPCDNGHCSVHKRVL